MFTSEFTPNAGINRRGMYFVSARYGTPQLSVLATHTGPTGPTGYSITTSTDGGNYQTITYTNNNSNSQWIRFGFYGLKSG